MARVRVRFDGVDDKAVAQLARTAALKATRRTQYRIQQNIRAAGRIQTGQMVQTVSLEHVPGRPALFPAYEVGARTPYAAYQEYGTRAHGPRTAKFMTFVPKNSPHRVFVKWVRGIKGAHFVRNAARALSPKDFT